MPGEIVSVPFLSQIEDMDKYLLEYRSLKLMPQNGNAYGGQHVRYNGGRTLGNNNSGSGPQNGRKKTLGGISSTSGASTQRYGNNGLKYGQQVNAGPGMGPGSGVAPLVAQQVAAQQAYPRLFYGPGGGNSLGLNQAGPLNVFSPAINSMGQQQQFQSIQQAQQSQQPTQPLMTASSSSSSTPPPRLHASISGSSSVSSLSNEYDFLLPSDLNGQFMSVNTVGDMNNTNSIGSVLGSSGVTTGVPLSGSYLDSGSAAPALVGHSKADFMGSSNSDLSRGILSSFLPENSHKNNGLLSNTGSASILFGSGTPYQAPLSGSAANSSTGFNMHNSKTWGSSTASASSTGGSFGIWNNDMSVWS
ncbi:LAMI_0D05204g1_1 [Lachancea mirantina]|uniref:LAMI_0D05204g1_1 n=1 Tax=Lachancea mirantina TaxID=1230905 RepID=A0A1G4JBM2_9SACH|nr:LAMI_0D05204g1_1 [Lachancea mirantina]